MSLYFRTMTMKPIVDVVLDSLFTGAVASIATTAAVAGLGKAEDDNAIAPLNAVSHIAWGDEAFDQDEASAKYTATGLALNTAAVMSWAGVHECLAGEASDRGDLGTVLASGAAVSALAYVTDYYVVPKRLTPGFEERLNAKSMFGVYTVLALGLATGSLLRSWLVKDQ
jgi:hypothetical protein